MGASLCGQNCNGGVHSNAISCSGAFSALSANVSNVNAIKIYRHTSI